MIAPFRRALPYFITPITNTNLHGGRWSSGKYVGTTCLRTACILAPDMACGVARQGVDPCLQVFLRECIPVAASDPLLFARLDARVCNPLLLLDG
jgi:hypothetical protein